MQRLKRFLLLFGYKLPFKKGVTLQLNKLKFPIPKGLCQVWLKMTHFVYVFLLFPYYLPLEKGVALI